MRCASTANNASASSVAVVPALGAEKGGRETVKRVATYVKGYAGQGAKR